MLGGSPRGGDGANAVLNEGSARWLGVCIGKRVPVVVACVRCINPIIPELPPKTFHVFWTYRTVSSRRLAWFETRARYGLLFFSVKSTLTTAMQRFGEPGRGLRVGMSVPRPRAPC